MTSTCCCSLAHLWGVYHRVQAALFGPVKLHTKGAKSQSVSSLKSNVVTVEQSSYIFVSDSCIEYPYHRSRKFTQMISHLKPGVWLEINPLDTTTVIKMYHRVTGGF